MDARANAQSGAPSPPAILIKKSPLTRSQRRGKQDKKRAFPVRAGAAAGVDAGNRTPVSAPLVSPDEQFVDTYLSAALRGNDLRQRCLVAPRAQRRSGAGSTRATTSNAASFALMPRLSDLKRGAYEAREGVGEDALQRSNAGSACQSGAQLVVAAISLMSHRMQNWKRPFGMSWPREVPMEPVKALVKTPLEGSDAGEFSDSGRGSLTSSEVPMKLVKELARTPSSGSTQACSTTRAAAL